MFYYLNGELALRDINMCVIDCGGVGYKLTISMITSESLASKLGQKVKLYTYLAVREDGVELFGFGSNEERHAFNLLTGVSGVGPKAAMNILSVMSPDRLAMAVCTEDIKGISKAPNIGAKTAARIVLELKDKIAKDFITSAGSEKAQEVSEAHLTHQQQVAIFQRRPRHSLYSDMTEALLLRPSPVLIPHLTSV